jgi:hypothetical protein
MSILHYIVVSTGRYFAEKPQNNFLYYRYFRRKVNEANRVITLALINEVQA